jgi:hypothetical protein
VNVAERTTNVTLKTTLSKDGRLVYSAEDAAHDARCAHELQSALVRVRDAWKQVAGFAVCESNCPEARYRITIDYPTLVEAQDAYRAMAEITKALEAAD